ncbi:MAG TPA: preQ(1) synthase [Candidatus Desulfovibrio intestinipullorum]|uniref:NADPH-dependent 7-cyano-7-deazaguanine reductase n=1 Tax=Candidatus Desulfovibrio intestinipullorum TaxID=2838536 RepID=A0A9D1PX05_9BACT|nr:preQ(1) synthase [Candidatus Desulfovibrio intestinipullorum]
METRSTDITEGLHALGKGGSPVPQQSPGIDILEAFPNRFPGRDYIISISFPEFTSLCPVTGQPDFGTIVLEYIPHERCVESKSFKLYMFAYRNHHSFMETITNTVLEDICTLLNPNWARVRGLFVPRGGTRLHVFAEEYRKDLDDEHRARIRELVREWKSEPDPHRG